jgi:alpha-galactosidase
MLPVWSTGYWKVSDMKALADYLYGRGLKLGIYSSPGPTTCQGLPGSWQHERIDAR